MDKKFGTFDDYQTMNGSLSLEEMKALHHEIMQEVGEDNEAKILLDDAILAGLAYAPIRGEWTRMSREEKQNADYPRTMAHNEVIATLNALADYLRSKGCACKWRDVLGDEVIYRKRLGDFGCYLAFVMCLMAR